MEFGRGLRLRAHRQHLESTGLHQTLQYGIRLALSGNRSLLAAGAPGQNGGGRRGNANPEDFSAPESGAVYAFLRAAGDKWSQHAYLKAPNSEEYDHFWSAVAVSANGSVFAAASDAEDGGSNRVEGDRRDNSIRDAGAVFVF